MTPTDESEPRRCDAAEMRQTFDRVFAAPDPAPVGEHVDFVTVRVGGRPFVLRVLDLAWVEAHRKIVALPGAHPWLLGLISARGKLVPVYSLELACGLPAHATEKPWVAICGRDAQFGLAFDALEGYVRVARAEVLGGTDTNRSQANQAVRVAGEVRHVVHLPAVLAAITDSHPRPAEELPNA